ncbi:MAG: D-glycero-beta-D-manno-heptose 1-phosphate adenylyltransferase, partial [Ignavibacteria bacterium]|nr:D-glycero-beta-D-manno-heptose 1-phosphate adenylyltransferase [Ignavibacteria bacterium]
AEIISDLIPDVLVKGADWAIDKIVGRQVVEASGGEVKTIQFVSDQSTSNIIKIIKERFKD